MIEDRRLAQLRTALNRARQRVERYRAELERFDCRADPGNVEDLRKAEDDAAWAEIALADATSPMEVPVGG